ncbi:MAG: RNA polymerase sigma factor [Nitrospirales bacterium]
MLQDQLPRQHSSYELDQAELEQQSLARLHEVYWDELVYFVNRQVHSPHIARDIAQEAFLRIIRNNNFHQIEHLKTYLFQVALNLTKDHYRTHTCHTNALQEIHAQQIHRVETRTGESILLAKEQLQLVCHALEELSPLCQRIFYLNRFEGLKHREIAERLHISKRTVEDNLKRALTHCLARLDHA